MEKQQPKVQNSVTVVSQPLELETEKRLFRIFFVFVDEDLFATLHHLLTLEFLFRFLLFNGLVNISWLWNDGLLLAQKYLDMAWARLVCYEKGRKRDLLSSTVCP